MFGHDFLWGTSVAGFQFEMGDAASKHVDQNTDWFTWVHDPENIRKRVVSGDLPENGINYWELYKSDHDLAKSLGMNAYRIGVEWSRIFPRSTAGIEVGVERDSDGTVSRVDIGQTDLERLDGVADTDAICHYQSVIDDLRSKEFRVIVCLNHFTLPLWIHEPIAVRDSRLRRGPKGWCDDTTPVEFTKYAAFLAWKLGDRVDMWATFNEPMVVVESGYLDVRSGFPPGLSYDIGAAKTGIRNMTAAHARAFDMVKKFDTARADDNGPSAAWVGLIHNSIPWEPLDPSNGRDVEAATFLDRLHNRLFIESATSGWLDINMDGIRDKGEIKGYLGSRIDWLGVNYYTRSVVRGKPSILARLFMGLKVMPEMVAGYGYNCRPRDKSLDGRPTSDFGSEFYPEGLAKGILEMSEFGLPLYVTENGLADARDVLRPRYLIDHLRTLETLIDEEKVDLRGYFHWSLTDNYEWARGFGMHFGLAEVDSRTKARELRKSADALRLIVEMGTTAGVQQ